MMLFFVVALAVAASASPTTDRDGKSVALFSVVTFPNDECQGASSTDSRGVCYSSSDCSARSGVKDGNCAAGFGVCCTFVIDGTSGGTISQNISFFQNNKFPSTITTKSTTTTYTISPISTEICQLRFDFVKLTLGQDTTTQPHACLDTLTITGVSGASPPVICTTTTTAWHLYTEVGTASGSTTVEVATGTATTGRTWKVKVSQIECSNPNKAPADCAQWYTSPTGTIQTLGFQSGLQLPAMNYAICIKENKAMCFTRISTDTSITTPDPFSLDGGANAAEITNAGTGTVCTNGALVIPSVVATTQGPLPAGINRFCGDKLNILGGAAAAGATVEGSITFKKPFQIRVITNGATNQNTDAGASLIYSQIGC